MSYEYDIFISYKRDANGQTLRWIKQHFEPLLALRVEQELGGGSVRIFYDEALESGASWPHDLGAKLGRSKILIALWSKNYFSSKWCALEMSHMLAREKAAKMRTAANPGGLIVPAIIHDGDDFPDDLSHIQKFEVKRCFNPRMGVDSPRAEELDDILAHEAVAMAKAINAAPRWKKNWPKQAATAFFNALYQDAPASQDTRPRYTA